MLSNLLQAILAVPKGLELILQILSFLQREVSSYENQKALEAMKQATEESKKTKDTSQMEDLFAGKK